MPHNFEFMREKLLKDTILSNEAIDFAKENMMPLNSLMGDYNCAIMEIETKFNVLNEQFSHATSRNPIEHIQTRTKTIDSIIKKMKRKSIPLTLKDCEEQVWDIAGVRVICSFVSDIYMLANCLLQQDDIVLVEKRDYIANPKPSGYSSLHLIVEVPIFKANGKKMMKVEVQLRTIAMDFWASLEHKMRYKKELSDELQENLRAELLECAQTCKELDIKMESIRLMIEEDQELKKQIPTAFSHPELNPLRHLAENIKNDLNEKNQ